MIGLYSGFRPLPAKPGPVFDNSKKSQILLKKPIKLYWRGFYTFPFSKYCLPYSPAGRRHKMKKPFKNQISEIHLCHKCSNCDINLMILQIQASFYWPDSFKRQDPVSRHICTKMVGKTLLSYVFFMFRGPINYQEHFY